MIDLSPFSTVAETTAGIRSKKISPAELVESHLCRIASLQPKLNAFVHLDTDGARAQARAAEAAVLNNQPLGPLHGVPITLKSCIDVSGWPCPAGSLLLRDYVPHANAPLVASLKASSAPAFHHGEGNYNPGTGYRDIMRFSQWLNLTGFPGASVPISLSAEGLPIGVQIIGRPFQDELVLAIAESLEQSRGPWKPPPLENI